MIRNARVTEWGFIVLALRLIAGLAVGQQVIYVPRSSSSGPASGCFTFTKPVDVVLDDGTKQTLSDARLYTIEGYLRTRLLLSEEEAGSLLGFRAAVKPKSRPPRDTFRDTDYSVLLPISDVARISFAKSTNPGASRRATVFFKDRSKPALTMVSEWRDFSWVLTGKVDVGGFGMADFSENLGSGKVSEIVLPIGEASHAIKQHSAVSAVVTDLGGGKHTLSDVRVDRGEFQFKKGEADIRVKIDRIQQIDVLGPKVSDYLCKVRLKSGAEQELLLHGFDSDIFGKGPNSFELLKMDVISSVEFTMATENGGAKAGRSAGR
jgi:hypothetical protein